MLALALGGPATASDHWISHPSGTAFGSRGAYNEQEGELLVAWGGNRRTDDGIRAIFGRRIGSDGEPRSRIRRFVKPSQGARAFLDGVAYDPAVGRYLVVWSEGRPGNDAQVLMARFFDARGRPDGASLTLATTKSFGRTTLLYNESKREYMLVGRQLTEADGDYMARVLGMRIDAISGTALSPFKRLTEDLDLRPFAVEVDSRSGRYLLAAYRDPTPANDDPADLAAAVFDGELAQVAAWSVIEAYPTGIPFSLLDDELALTFNPFLQEYMLGTEAVGGLLRLDRFGQPRRPAREVYSGIDYSIEEPEATFNPYSNEYVAIWGAEGYDPPSYGARNQQSYRVASRLGLWPETGLLRWRFRQPFFVFGGAGGRIEIHPTPDGRYISLAETHFYPWEDGPGNIHYVGAASGPAGPPPLVKISQRKRAVESGSLHVRVGCLAARSPCRGKLKLRAADRLEWGGPRPSRVTFGKARFEIPAGKRRAVEVAVSAKAVEALNDAGAVLVQATAKTRSKRPHNPANASFNLRPEQP